MKGEKANGDEGKVWHRTGEPEGHSTGRGLGWAGLNRRELNWTGQDKSGTGQGRVWLEGGVVW